ncbi:MAG TPA: regulatory protein RecX [Pseudonocardiaceae bacterium]|nr:regulatory protein RecX [Pseudonocardiaceae bacterium]
MYEEESSGGGRARRGGRGRSGARTRSGSRSRDDAATPETAPVDQVGKAREICLNLLATRPRTRTELRAKLLERGIEEPVADQVLSRLNEVGLVDDAAFAEMWVRSRHNYQGMSRRALSFELRRKGVADELAADAVSAVDSEAEEAKARELVRKRMRSVAGTAPEQTLIRRLVGMLARKGYSEGLAYRVVRDEMRNAGNDTDLLDDALPD